MPKAEFQTRSRVLIGQEWNNWPQISFDLDLWSTGSATADNLLYGY